jgi:integrase
MAGYVVQDVLRLEATKTENERDIPLWTPIKQVIQGRMTDGLIDDEYLFPRATIETFDNAIARACRKAGRVANLNYGRKNGFTCHSLRHTFITDMMEATSNDIDLVMSWSGHKSLESFKIYLHPTKIGVTLGEQRATQVADLVQNYSERLAQERNAEQPEQFSKRLKK